MMYCSKCGTKVNEEYNFCPNCQNRLNLSSNDVIKEEVIVEVKAPKTKVDKFTFGLSLFSIFTGIVPANMYLVLFGIIVGLVCVVIETVNIIKSETKKPLLTVVLSITAVVTNLGWYYFLYYLV